jgi:hypothetical protein
MMIIDILVIVALVIMFVGLLALIGYIAGKGV